MQDVFIRSVTEDDLMAVWRIYSDQQICLMCGAKPANSIVDAAAILDIMIKNGGNFAIVLKETMSVIGIISVRRDIHRYNKKAYMLGYLLEKSYWGRGFMPQAVKLMTEYTFNYLGADLISATHFKDNLQSKRVLEKCGFQYEGTLRREYVRWDGSVLDSCVYSLLWEEHNNKGEKV